MNRLIIKSKKEIFFLQKNKNKKPKELDLYYEFFNDTISKLPLDGKLELFKDQLYLVPNGLPSLSGVRLLRRGLHLGTLLKNRFEPSHALATIFIKRYGQKICRYKL
ncbi:RsmF rRNA methyltransferase first C-terminal domain-containing protein [Lachnobacterium bovis]|uniref:RsmF rRNA methyltransferase first C-terminal domain-containing protein n=1 Tax=Lachnobacterium bovis TaxID=140626 RepID=UPI0004905245|nr:RsmF rRNA methyltransferase first C-terminal domain-containing protein [Lachnobacterium bovis]